MTALLIAVGYFIGGRNGAVGFLLFSLVMNFATYFWSDKIALGMARAQPLPEAGNSAIYSEVSHLAGAMQIPVPKLYSSQEAQANAFATGRNPAHSSICLTKGIMEILSKDELRGVIAHEMAHIKNRDVLISTIAAVFAGAVSNLANMAMWFGHGDGENRNPLGGILMMILGPIAAMLIQMAISRQREYAADETGGKISRNPLALASALRKIEESVTRAPMTRGNMAMSSLYIENPFKMGGIAQMFSTHPPTGERIARLEKMTP